MSGPWASAPGKDSWIFHAKGPINGMSIMHGDGNVDNIRFSYTVPAKVARVGPWGKRTAASPHNHWSFRLEEDHKLKKITIDHGKCIYSFIFTSEDSHGTSKTSNKIGGWNGGEKVSEIVFDRDEEIIAMSGTFGDLGGYVIIKSLTLVTNKKTYGTFGNAIGTAFEVPWDKCSFAGFYGLAGYYIDSIGIYLKANI